MSEDTKALIEWGYWPWISVTIADPPIDETLFAAVQKLQGSYDIFACIIVPESGDLVDASTRDDIGWDVADITFWFQVPALPPLPRHNLLEKREDAK